MYKSFFVDVVLPAQLSLAQPFLAMNTKHQMKLMQILHLRTCFGTSEHI